MENNQYTVSTAVLQNYNPYIVSSTVGVSYAHGGVVDTNGPLLLRVGVGLLTAAGESVVVEPVTWRWPAV